MSAIKTLNPSPKLRTKYHWTVWLVLALGFLPFALLGLIPYWGWTFVWWYLVGNAVWVIIAHLLIPPYYASISYELGERELVERKGILTKVENVVPYRMVTNISVKRGVLDRWLGIGSLEIHTAGFSQQANAEAKMVGLVDYETARKDLISRLPQTPPMLPQEQVATGDTAGQQDVIQLLKEIRDELRAR